MGCGEIEDLELASMDLYTRIKLRAANAQRSEYRNVEWIDSKGVSANQISSIKKWEGFKCLLEIAKGEENGKKSNAWSNLSDEGTAVEMLGELSKGRLSNFTTGDFVWGKVKTHPWWPGQIYDESKVSPSVLVRKIKGCVLVAFFGDDTYKWLNLSNVVAFEPHFAEKSKHSKDGLFVKAIEEAVCLVKKRSALGLTCKCRDRFDVDVNVYSKEQIEKARNYFEPHEMLSFVQRLALRPNMNVRGNFNWIENASRALAYRKGLFEEFDETYDEAFGSTVVNEEDPDEEKAREECENGDSSKQVEQGALKVKVKSSNWRESVRQKRCLEDISVVDEDYSVQPSKKRSI